MRSFIAFFLIAAFFAVASSYPAEDNAQSVGLQTVDDQENAPEQHIRHKRVTCDIGSFFNLHHAACAINCIRKGFRGGWCDNRAVCNCRH